MRLKKMGIGILMVIFGFVVLMGVVYQFKLYRPTETAEMVLQASNVQKDAQYILINGKVPLQGNIVFYQGGLVETAAYTPLAMKFAEKGYNVYLPKMPFNLAILNSDAFDEIKREHDDGLPWYIGGHSLGGTSALLYLSKESPIIDGLFLLASYGTEETVLTEVTYPVVSIVGADDGILDFSSYNAFKANLPPTTVYDVMEGANHSGFGNYGLQKGEKLSALTAEEQQQQTVALILKVFQSQSQKTP